MMSPQEAPKIIVVDDSDDDFLLIQRELCKAWPQAEVVHAEHAQALETALESDTADVVICDYAMPTLTHEHVADIIARLRPQTPLILLSGLASEAVGAQAMHAGVRDYVEKSKPQRLIPAVRREIHTHQLQREKQQLEQAHRRAAYFDAATGFLNRQGLVKTLSGLASKRPSDKDLCMLTINFSRNQARGPEVDPRIRRNMLEKIVTRVRDNFPKDIVCRWSDNLMVVVTDNIHQAANPDKTAELLAQLEGQLNRPFMIENFPVRPGMRMGLARPGVDGIHAAELVTHAQAVAYVLEAEGKDLLDALSPDVHQQAKRRKKIELGLAKGIEGNELVLDFQPIEDLRTGKICGVEALVRWTHPELGRIMPSEFIGVAEDSGLIDALGDWVIKNATEKLLTLHQAGYPLWCAVNCSAGQLLNPDFPAKANANIRTAGLDPVWIEFEVTESAAIDDMQRTVDALLALRQEGSRVAMDDFGTGYASLNYLRQLPVDVLKIDKSFVMDLLKDQNSHMIVKAVIDLAHALGLKVHAEGIETEAQRATLMEMGCDRLQGYWFSKPLSLESLLDWLRQPSRV
ncbi:MAG TPA: EAL domain-containing protein [Limnobacter sp.]|nr:EAL domain-containing protein [Limnobacter sp.]